MRRPFTSLLAQGVKAFSYYTGWYPLWQQPDGPRPIILFYHKVQRRPVGTWGEEVLDLEAFKQHMAFLSREYEPIPLSELVAALQGKIPMPDRAVAITFDDGYRNNLRLAAPILRHYRVPATLFISTGLIGTNQWMWAYELEEIFHRYPLEAISASARHPLITRLCAQAMNSQVALVACVEYLKSVPHPKMLEVVCRIREQLPVELDEENQFLSWDEVRQLRSYGFEFGAHTESHPILIRQRLEDAERELVACCDTLERELGTRPKLFAYPNGDTSPAVTALVGRYFEAAVTTHPGVCSPSGNLLELPRVGAPRVVSDLAFQMERHLRQGGHALQAQAY
ncbi:MAG: polysaccharide deacetylase family protein [Myxococcaceae bacterium]|nr:polysaccharide deacetylase family protein [Myxococcaceae bacterium]